VNHIPVREAFPWTPNPDDPGTAVFYKDTGPWWDQSYFKTGESVQLALLAQQKDPESLWNLYRELIFIRRTSDAIKYGNFDWKQSGEKDILAFSRETPKEKVSVMMNLSEHTKTIRLPSVKQFQFQERTTIKGDSLILHPYGYIIYDE
jgi:alpha-amylase